MKLKNVVALFVVSLVCSAQAAVIEILNNTRETFDIQTIESREDEYRVGVYKYLSVGPWKKLQHNSWLKEILGFRWRKIMVSNIDGTRICVEYSIILPQPISRFITNGLLEILPEGKLNYYFDKKNLNHRYELTANKNVYRLFKSSDIRYNKTENSELGDWVISQ